MTEDKNPQPQERGFFSSLESAKTKTRFPRIIKGRPFEVGFECDAKLYRKEHPYGH
jgi:hypothetical protein